MPIRLLGLKAVQRTQLSQRLAAASAASLALGSFPFHRGRAQAVRGEEPARGSPAALEQHGSISLGSGIFITQMSKAPLASSLSHSLGVPVMLRACDPVFGTSEKCRMSSATDLPLTAVPTAGHRVVR